MIADGHEAALVVGSNDAEASSAAGAAADLRTITLSESCAVTEELEITGTWRKTAGAASFAQLGLKVNGGADIFSLSVTTATNQAEFGTFRMTIRKQQANHLRSAWHEAIGTGDAFVTKMRVASADLPNATITSVTIVGNSGSASQTIAIANVTVRKLAGN